MLAPLLKHSGASCWRPTEGANWRRSGSALPTTLQRKAAEAQRAAKAQEAVKAQLQAEKDR
jgi:hypothetical protein